MGKNPRLKFWVKVGGCVVVLFVVLMGVWVINCWNQMAEKGLAYDKITLGMPQAEVEMIAGEPTWIGPASERSMGRFEDRELTEDERKQMWEYSGYKVHAKPFHIFLPGFRVGYDRDGKVIAKDWY